MAAPSLSQFKSRKGTTLHGSLVEGSEKPVIVMIHNMWGSHKTFKRHVDFFNSHGYSCITFDLIRGSRSSDSAPTQDSLKNTFRFLYLNWVEQISDVLDSIPGPKILFSFSGPSLAALISASVRTDIYSYICDGGPFKELWQCIYRMYTLEKPIKNPILRFCMTTLSCVLWGPWASAHLARALHHWPSRVPVLSIRGGCDPIVYPQNIDTVFSPHHHIKLTVHTIKKGQHLDGLKNFPEDYTTAVLTFLKNETLNS